MRRYRKLSAEFPNCFGVCIVDFEQGNACLKGKIMIKTTNMKAFE